MFLSLFSGGFLKPTIGNPPGVARFAAQDIPMFFWVFHLTKFTLVQGRFWIQLQEMFWLVVTGTLVKCMG